MNLESMDLPRLASVKQELENSDLERTAWAERSLDSQSKGTKEFSSMHPELNPCFLAPSLSKVAI